MHHLLTRWTATAAVLPLTLALAACGSDDGGAKPTFPSEAPALWNPCDSLDAALVLKAFGSRTKEQDGTPTQPDCRFVPVDKKAGDPAVTANYQLTAFDLDTFFKSMHAKKTADVRTPTIALADDARIVVDHTKKLLAITGFVQNGDLFQVVNVLDPTPYDESRDVAGVETLLTALSKHADETNAGASASVTATAKP
jgi:hypothetical protein